MISIAGQQYALRGQTVIGRAHAGCPLKDCRRKGFGVPPEVAIVDRERYVGKHHARLWLDSSHNCWIEDLNSLNGTAIHRVSDPKRARVFHFEMLVPERPYVLIDGDLVALGYSPKRGPYMTLSFTR